MRVFGPVGADDGLEGLVEDCFEPLAGEGGALEVLEGADLVGHGLALLLGDGRLVLAGEVVDGLLVLSEIDLGADEDDGGVGAVVLDFAVPSVGDVH